MRNQTETKTVTASAKSVARMMADNDWPQMDGFEFAGMVGDKDRKLYKLTYRAIEAKSEVKAVRRGTRRDSSDKAAQERAAKRLGFQRKLAAGVATASVIVTAVIASLPL